MAMGGCTSCCNAFTTATWSGTSPNCVVSHHHSKQHVHRYDALCQKHASVLNAQPALVEAHVKLREKITLLSLLQLIFSLPADHRTIALSDVASRTKLNGDGVEFLLMKAMSLKLIEGIMDQVDGTVQVTWVQPQVLTLPQIQALHMRLGAWIGKVHTAELALEQDSLLIAD